MVNFFLDVNCTRQLLQGTNHKLAERLQNNQVHVSALSVHILAYINKIKMPNNYYSSFLQHLTLGDLTTPILKKALKGPTNDLEDNIQLHTALAQECEVFVTLDKGLLKLKSYENMTISTPDEL